MGNGLDDDNAVLQLRLVVEADDFDEAIAFYRDALGLTEELFIESEHGARVMILDAGRATLEIINKSQKHLIDELEVGSDVARHFRVAFEVSDATATTEKLKTAGAELLAPPTPTPWNSLNARLEGPAGIQLTIFQELEGG